MAAKATNAIVAFGRGTSVLANAGASIGLIVEAKQKQINAAKQANAAAHVNNVQNKVDRLNSRINAFESKITGEAAAYGSNPTAQQQAKLQREQNNFAGNIKKSGGLYTPIDLTQQPAPTAIAPAPGPATNQAAVTTQLPDPSSLPVSSSFNASDFGSAPTADLSTVAAPAGVPATVGAFPTWAKVAIIGAGAIAVWGIYKYGSITAPFSKTLNRVQGVANSGAPKSAGRFFGKLTA